MARASKYVDHRDEVLRLIDAAMRSHAKPPTVRDLADETGVGVATMHSYLMKMADEGVIEWRAGRHRSIKVTPQGSQELSA